MGTFTHTPDNDIYLNNSRIPLSFFVTLVPTYALPAGYTSRFYEQTVCNVLSDGTSATADTIPWADGDTYISNEVAYAALYAASLPTIPSLSAAKLTRIYQMEQYALNTIKSGNVVVAGNTFFSDLSTLQGLTNDDLTYTRAGALPGGYYVNDITYTQIVMAALANLEAIIDKIVALHHATNLVADTHRAAINALVTVAAVQAYDYTTGWPTVPYT